MPRTYFYEQGAQPESMFRGLPKYRTTIPKSKIYNLVDDPKGFTKNLTATEVENAIKAAGYKGYMGELGGQKAYALFYPQKAFRTQEVSVGISPYASSRIKAIDKLYRAGKWDKIHAMFESDARKLLSAPNTTFQRFDAGIGMYGGVREPSPRLVLEYAGEPQVLRKQVAQLAKAYKQESAVISRAVDPAIPLEFAPNNNSAILEFAKPLSKKEQRIIGLVLKRSGLGGNVTSKDMLIHHIPEFSGMADEQYGKAVAKLTSLLGDKGISFKSSGRAYAHDVLWNQDYDRIILGEL